MKSRLRTALCALALALAVVPASADNDVFPWWLQAPPTFPATPAEHGVAEAMRVYATPHRDPCFIGGDYGERWIADTHGGVDPTYFYRSLFFATTCKPGGGQVSSLQQRTGTWLQVIGRQDKITGDLWIKHTDLATCGTIATCAFHDYVHIGGVVVPPPPIKPPCYFSGHHVCP